MRERLILALAVVCTLGTASQASAEDAVVVASTAPGYTPGELIREGTAVRVPEGASTTLLLSTGRSILLRGPFEGEVADAPSEASSSSLKQLWAGGAFAQTELGASRSLQDFAAQPVPAIDLSRPGRHCVTGDGPLLRKPDDPALAALALEDPKTGTTATLDWSADGMLAWPAGLPSRDGTRLTVTDVSGKPLHEIEIRRIDAATPVSAGMAVALAAAGCRHEAAEMLEPIRDAMVPLELYLSSDRGLFPTYRNGEPIQLVLQTNRDAHLYCYQRNARGDLIPIFPSSRSGGSAVKAHTPLIFPGERMPHPLRAENQEILCHATERDMTAELPGRGYEFQPLQDDALAGLDRALETLGGQGSASARVVLGVE